MKVTILILRALFVLLLTFSIISKTEAKKARLCVPQRTAVYPSKCKHGLQYGPEKKFAVYVFCDDAVGTSIGIINTTPGSYVGPGSEEAWSIETRFWQESSWGRDVMYLEWSKDGLKLTVYTNYIYGTNKKYVLDLAQKKIESEVENPGLEIFDFERGKGRKLLEQKQARGEYKR